MPRTKLTDKQKKKIIADYVENGNYSETARMNNTTDTTVRTIVKENKDDALEKIEKKKEEDMQDILQYMDSKKEDKKRVVDLCFKALQDKLAKPDMFTNVKDIATVYGIIIDKDLKYKEMKLKAKELPNNDENAKIQILNDLPREDEKHEC